MKSERLFRILGLIDEELIDEAAPTAAVPRRKNVWRKALAAAACLTLVCGFSLAWLVTGGFRGMGASAPVSPPAAATVAAAAVTGKAPPSCPTPGRCSP